MSVAIEALREKIADCRHREEALIDRQREAAETIQQTAIKLTAVRTQVAALEAAIAKLAAEGAAA